MFQVFCKLVCTCEIKLGMLCALICGTCIALLQITKTRAMKLSCSKFFKVLFLQQLSNLLHSTKLIFKVAKGIFTGCTCTGLPFYIILTDNFLLCLILSPFFTVVMAIVLTVMHATYSVHHFPLPPPNPPPPALLVHMLSTHSFAHIMIVATRLYPTQLQWRFFGGAGRGWSPDDTKFH